MRRPGWSDKAWYEQELNHYRSLANANKGQWEGKHVLAVQLNFWMESVRFLITELEIWNYMQNTAKYSEALDKLDKAFGHIHRLVIYLEEDNSQGYDPDPEI